MKGISQCRASEEDRQELTEQVLRSRYDCQDGLKGGGLKVVTWPLIYGEPRLSPSRAIHFYLILLNLVACHAFSLSFSAEVPSWLLSTGIVPALALGSIKLHSQRQLSQTSGALYVCMDLLPMFE